jgi:DNA-binding NarL/FixJ family response regulator
VAGDNLPDLAGPELAQRLKAQAPGVGVILLTLTPELPGGNVACATGADCYLDKKLAASGDLAAAVIAVATARTHAAPGAIEGTCR